MRMLQELLEGNRHFAAAKFDAQDALLDAPPTKGLAVVACMDARHNVERVLGLSHGDAVILRNAGNVVDDGTLRSLVVAVHLFGVRTIAVLGHSDCGMAKVGRGEFRVARSLAAHTSIPLHDAMRPDFQRWLGGFTDVEDHVRRSVDLLRSHPFMPPDVEVFGLLYDNETGRVRAVDSSEPRRSETDVPVEAPVMKAPPSPSPGSSHGRGGSRSG